MQYSVLYKVSHFLPLSCRILPSHFAAIAVCVTEHCNKLSVSTEKQIVELTSAEDVIGIRGTHLIPLHGT